MSKSNEQKLKNFSIPVFLTDEILNEYPNNMWGNPFYKFCYLTAVDGYMVDKMFDKLNEGLKNIFPNENERREHIFKNMLFAVVIDKFKARLVKNTTSLLEENIYIKNVTEDDLTNMPKFDFIVQNPPYGRNLMYLKFINKGYELLKKDGIMISIQPAKFLTSLRVGTKKRIKNSCNFLDKITKVKIDNYSELFNIGIRDYISIITVDKNKNKDDNNIKFTLFENEYNVNNIDDINYFGSYLLITSIFDKVNKKAVCKTQELISSKKENNAAYIRVSNKLTYHGDKDYKNDTDTFFDNQHKNELGEDWQMVYRYIAHVIHKNDNKIVSQDSIDTKNTYIKINFKESYIENESILSNFIYFVCHSILGHILCMLLFQDENGHNYRNVFPFIIFNNKLNDNEYYKYFDLSSDEIQLLEKCHRQFERKSKTNFLY